MNSLNESESSLEDIELSFLENLDSFELEQLENEAINTHSQSQDKNRNQNLDHLIKYQTDVQDIYKKHDSNNDETCIQDLYCMQTMQKNAMFTNAENADFNNLYTESNQNNINKWINACQWNNTNLPSDSNLQDKYEKHSQMMKANVDISHETILKLQSYIKHLQLERDKFEAIAQSKSKELSMTQALLNKKQQLYVISIENIKKQHDFSLKRLSAAKKKTEDDLNRVLTENQFQKKELEEASEIIKQFECSRKQTNTLLNISSEFLTKKEFESKERIIDLPMKRKRKSKNCISLNSTVHKHEYTESFYFQNNKNLTLQRISTTLFQQMNNYKKLQFIEELFGYRIDYIFNHNDNTVLDILSSYKLHESSISISSIIIKFISDSLSSLDSVLKFLLYLIDCITTIWRNCLEKSYDKPIIYIVSLVHFIIVFCPYTFNELHNIDKSESFLELIRDTVTLYVTKTMKETEFFKCINQFILEKCLEILNVITSLSEKNEQIIYRVHSLFEFNFILIILNSQQNLLFIKKTLNFLNKYIFSKYVVCGTKKDSLVCDPSYFSEILDVVSKYLIEKYENYEIYELMDLKLEVVMFLNAIVLSYVNGKDLLGLNVLVVSRLCRCLTELVNLHGISEISIQRINIIKYIVLILHEIISPTNLSLHFSQPWTQYTYIVSMARLSFVEDEDCHGKDIFDDKTIELARDLLEMVVGPEEGDELYDFFHISS
ncbi:hypothetical protein PORY_002651 [Pneumocystis oryctolagi]|uniref:Uncharacterized protein n=1 Tax=Pneumocystis oryctolagi TaxID=42067 RepID=A0ACB7CAR0_9ASCO|nr:hypothetical protein PORY_002651 [Pneumocystis oryctolagi]